MQVVCLQENLQKSLTLVSRVVSQKIQLPVLSNVLIKAHKGSFSLWATDLELGIRVETAAKIEADGEITIPAKLFYELVSALPPEKIEIKTEGTTLNLKTKNQKSTITGIPATEFPIFDKKNGDRVIRIDKEALRRAIKIVSFAAALDDNRPVLNGVLFRGEKGQYSFVATDGYRLSFQKIEGVVEGREELTLIIPSRVLREVNFLLDKGSEADSKMVDIFLTPKENQIKFAVGENILIGRLIEGEFPDYEKIIPRSATTIVLIDREELLGCAKITSIFARDSANIIKLVIKKAGISVFASASQVGENQSFVSAQVSGDDNEIAFNSRFLLELLTSLDEKEIVFEMTGPLNPGVFKVKNSESYLHLIMPIRIQE